MPIFRELSKCPLEMAARSTPSQPSMRRDLQGCEGHSRPGLSFEYTCADSALPAGARRPSIDSQSGLKRVPSAFDEADAAEEGGEAALPAPILTPEGARQLSALMDGVVHDFMGMVRFLQMTCDPSGFRSSFLSSCTFSKT